MSERSDLGYRNPGFHRAHLSPDKHQLVLRDQDCACSSGHSCLWIGGTLLEICNNSVQFLDDVFRSGDPELLEI